MHSSKKKITMEPIFHTNIVNISFVHILHTFHSVFIGIMACLYCTQCTVSFYSCGTSALRIKMKLTYDEQGNSDFSLSASVHSLYGSNHCPWLLLGANHHHFCLSAFLKNHLATTQLMDLPRSKALGQSTGVVPSDTWC